VKINVMKILTGCGVMRAILMDMLEVASELEEEEMAASEIGELDVFVYDDLAKMLLVVDRIGNTLGRSQ
jgi:hypothetical protein